MVLTRYRRRRHARARMHRRRRHGHRYHLRRRRFHRKPRTFHLRFHRTVTTDWKQATTSGTDGVGDKTLTLGWNMDHLYFTLEEFIKEAKTTQIPTTSQPHNPPFRLYRIKKVVVRGTWINYPQSLQENVLGCTALDLDGEDEGRGDTSPSSLDPKEVLEQPGLLKSGPLTYNPLQNRSSRKFFNMRHGFKRVFRPRPQILSPLTTGGNYNLLFPGRTPWVQVVNGSDVHWEGLSISMRQVQHDKYLPQVQYDVDAYIEFKEFDYESGTQSE